MPHHGSLFFALVFTADKELFTRLECHPEAHTKCVQDLCRSCSSRGKTSEPLPQALLGSDCRWACDCHQMHAWTTPPHLETRTTRSRDRVKNAESRRIEHKCSSSNKISIRSGQPNPLQSPMIVRGYLPGTPLTVMSLRMSTQERSTVDRAIALHLRQLSSLAAPTFGSTWRVFGEGGSSTWREAFLGMLESALRDCEDLMLTVPYEPIRQLANQHAGLLDDISEARLVVLDAGLERNVLINETNHEVVGLLGLANVVWGDPFMGSVFFRASDAFWQAFGSAARSMPGYEGRMFLYAMYRSIVSIAEAHIRPQGGDEDAVARRTLTWALNQLSSS